MTSALHGKTIHELQELAQQTPVAPRKRSANRLSRAARQHLIDILSRWSGAGLALVAGVSIYLAITAGRAYPTRAAAWALMMLAALWTCRRLRSQFRAGSSQTGRPFRWRAAFTSCLCVLGVAFASAPILLAPASAPAAAGFPLIALSLAASFAAALLLAAHFPSAAALAIPGAAFAILTGLRTGDTGLLLAALATSVLGLTGLVMMNKYLEKSAARRYPRMTLLRQEVERREGGANRSTGNTDTGRALQA